MNNLTKEQQDVVDTVLDQSSKEKIVAVNAIAGSGKTSTCKAIISAFKPKNGFYTAFNKSVVEEAKKKFKNYNVDVRTIHSLAFKYSKTTIDQVGESHYTELGIADDVIAYKALEKFNEYCLSKYIDLYEFFDETSIEDEDIKQAVVFIFDRMLGKALPCTFNFLLKLLHIKLKQGLVKIEYDLALLDEAQDTTAVALEIFKLIKADRKVILGDTHQNIYSFMNTVNAFDEIDPSMLINKALTQSFRCESSIASKVETFINKNVEKYKVGKPFKFTGVENTEPDNTSVYLVRHNMALIDCLVNLVKDNIPFRLIRKPQEIFSLLLSLDSVYRKGSTNDTKYNYLNNLHREYEISGMSNNFLDFLKITQTSDVELIYSISLLRRLWASKINIYQLYNRVKELEDSKSNLVVSTVHTYKGLEADTVFIHSSVSNSVSTDSMDSINIMYVAMSRAKKKLILMED